MEKINKLVRENIRKLKAYSSARDEFTGQEGIFMDANENPYGLLNRYPDPYQKELKETISLIKEVDKKNIFLGNGSDEIIDLTFRIFCTPGNEKVLIFPPTYGMYEVAAAINDIEVVKIPLKADFQIDLENAGPLFINTDIKLLFICSPNNPTGNSMNEEDILYILENFKGIVVLDEAYMDFSRKASFISMIDRFPRLIVLQTFSKALGLAAVRIGMAFTNTNIIHYLNKLKPPYNISTINQKTAKNKILMIEEYTELVRIIIEERERLSARLKKLKLIDYVYPSDANFLLVKVGDPDAVYKTLIDNGIIVRNRSSILEGCLRITVGTREENDRLIETLENIRL